MLKTGILLSSLSKNKTDGRFCIFFLYASMNNDPIYIPFAIPHQSSKTNAQRNTRTVDALKLRSSSEGRMKSFESR